MLSPDGCSGPNSYCIVVVISKEGLVGPCLASFFWYDNDRDLKGHVFAAHTSHHSTVSHQHSRWISVVDSLDIK